MPPTEAVMPPTEQPPTLAAGVIGQAAWSDPFAVPYYKPPRNWRRVLEWVKYLVPAVVVAIILLVALGGHRPQQQPAPTPAPPTAVTEAWAPDHSKDDAYIKALINSGFLVGGVNDTTSDAPSREESLENAYWSCTNLSEGHSISDVVKHWDEFPADGVPPAANHDNDVQWVNIMVENLCPQFAGQKG